MDRYKRKPVIVEAVRFDPEKPWPDIMHPWPLPNGAQPRDMSFGYITVGLNSWLHVNAGDWLIYEINGDKVTWSELVSDEDFKESYERVGGLVIV